MKAVLYAFKGGADGANPVAGLLTLTTCMGQQVMAVPRITERLGAISPSGSEKVLYSFTGGQDGGDTHGSFAFNVRGTLTGRPMTRAVRNFYYGTVFR